MNDNNNPITILIIGGGDRGNTYAKYSKLHPEQMKVLGIAEPSESRRQSFAEEYNIPTDNSFSNFQDMLSKNKFADAVIISTPDHLHYEPAMMAIEKGYDILLEKPIANKLEECTALNDLNKKHNRIVGVCHVLRYAPFYVKLKEIIDSGMIGEVLTIEHIEGIGWWHYAHSYVRGNWRDTTASSPMILAKSCHDMDIILWLIGRDCIKISSFGTLSHFKKENAPSGSTERCTDGCKVESECPYSALKLYMDMEKTGWPVNIISDDLSFEGRMKAMMEGSYGRCVYRCDNNAVDHQVVSLEFEEGETASFTMSAFTEMGRKIRIMGTMGEVSGDGKIINYANFRNGKNETFDTGAAENDIDSGHGGGDYGMLSAFINSVKHQDASLISSTLDVSVQSHQMAFAAEKSRVEGKIIVL